MSRLDRFKEIGTSLTNTGITTSRETVASLQSEIERLQLSQPTTYLSPHAIRRSPYQPRKYFDPDSQSQLNANVREFGILQNLVVRPVDGGYELIAGERRLIASLVNNLNEVPVAIRPLSDRDARRLALAENLHRDNLNPIEETEAILHLLTIELDVESVEQVKTILYALDNLAKGKKVTHNVMGNVEEYQAIVTQAIADNTKGMTWRSFINNRLPLLNLPLDVLTAIMKGEIEYTKGKAIAKIADLEQREQILSMAIDQRWTLAQINEKIKSDLTPPLGCKPDSQLVNVEPKQRLQSTLKKATSIRIWQDPQKWKKMEKLLTQIDLLLSQEPG